MLADIIIMTNVILLSFGSLRALCKGNLSKLDAVLLLGWWQCEIENHAIVFNTTFILERVGRTGPIDVLENLAHHFLKVITLEAFFRCSI